jgi:hypothetical protein
MADSRNDNYKECLCVEFVYFLRGKCFLGLQLPALIF